MCLPKEFLVERWRRRRRSSHFRDGEGTSKRHSFLEVLTMQWKFLHLPVSWGENWWGAPSLFWWLPVLTLGLLSCLVWGVSFFGHTPCSGTVGHMLLLELLEGFGASCARDQRLSFLIFFALVVVLRSPAIPMGVTTVW